MNQEPRDPTGTAGKPTRYSNSKNKVKFQIPFKPTGGN